jgi:hypothetical protein
VGQLGAPTAKSGHCWLYQGEVGRIRGRLSGSYVDAMKFCFGEGPAGGRAVTKILSHDVAHTIVARDGTKKHFPAQWGGAITIMRVPDWYLQENS